MKKILRYIVTTIMALVLLTTSDSHFDAADVGLKASASSVEIGDSVTMTITFPENITGTVHLIFSEDLLTYSSASTEVGVSTGQIRVHVGKLSAAGSNTVTVTFKAKTAGEATVKASVIEAYNNDSLDSVSVGDASAKITIKNETQEDKLSSDYYLSKLNITAGSKAITLSPTFKYSKTSYTATVDYDVSSVVVSATRSDGKAEIVSITDNGNVKLEVGKNVIEIVVKAENGKTLTYKVTITRKEKPTDTQQPNPTEDPNPTENPQPQQPDFEINGTPLYIQEIPDAKIPVDFVEKTILLNGGKEVSGISFEKGDLTVLYLENDSKVGGLYVYDAEDNYVYPFIKLSSEDAYVIVLMPDDATAPEGYNACTLSIEGKGIVNAYQYQVTRTVDLSDFYLIYCISSNGTKGWYQYDSLEGTYQRYSGIVPTGPIAPDTETPSETESASGETGASNNENEQSTVAKFDWKEYQSIIICVAVFLAAVIVIIIINILLAKQRKDGTDEEEDDYDDYDEEDYENNESEVSEENSALEDEKEKTKEDEVEFIDL